MALLLVVAILVPSNAQVSDNAGQSESQSQSASPAAAGERGWLSSATDWAQIIQAVVAVVLLIYLLGFATDLRESIAARHLDGMKYVRDIIGTEEAAQLRRWVYQELSKEQRPLRGEAKERVRRIGRDFDHIGLLCRKGLLPAHIIATTYNRNITRMWNLLKTAIGDLRTEDNDPDYFAEFQWLAMLASEKERALKDGKLKW